MRDNEPGTKEVRIVGLMQFTSELEMVRENGACSPDVEYLFHSNEKQNVLAAKAICRQCNVQVECLRYALDYGERYGTWGGMSDRERRRLLSNRKKSKTQTL